MTIVTDSRKVKDSDEMFAKLLEPKEFASVVGACIYISTTCRPDISHAVGRLSRTMHNPILLLLLPRKSVVAPAKQT